jgi:hypothetical protein
MGVIRTPWNFGSALIWISPCVQRLAREVAACGYYFLTLGFGPTRSIAPFALMMIKSVPSWASPTVSLLIICLTPSGVSFPTIWYIALVAKGTGDCIVWLRLNIKRNESRNVSIFPPRTSIASGSGISIKPEPLTNIAPTGLYGTHGVPKPSSGSMATLYFTTISDLNRSRSGKFKTHPSGTDFRRPIVNLISASSILRFFDKLKILNCSDILSGDCGSNGTTTHGPSRLFVLVDSFSIKKSFVKSSLSSGWNEDNNCTSTRFCGGMAVVIGRVCAWTNFQRKAAVRGMRAAEK